MNKTEQLTTDYKCITDYASSKTIACDRCRVYISTVYHLFSSNDSILDPIENMHVKVCNIYIYKYIYIYIYIYIYKYIYIYIYIYIYNIYNKYIYSFVYIIYIIYTNELSTFIYNGIMCRMGYYTTWIVSRDTIRLYS